MLTTPPFTLTTMQHNKENCTMDKTIYCPYFYIIQHINSGKYYAGVRYGKNANPDQLLKSNGYNTSSAVVKEIILDEGLESFIIRKIKIFETGEQALEYESRFLRKVNASFNNNFLNKSNNSISTLNIDWEKCKQTFLDRYGVSHPSQVPEFQEKIKQTCQENYGVENPSQSPEIQEKKKQNFLEKYGVEYPMQSKEVQEKSRRSCLEKYGVEYNSQVQEFKEKRKQTCLDHYGVEYLSQSEEIQERKRRSCLEKYGVESPSQVPEVKEKFKQTCLEKYGVESPSQAPEVREKIKQTCLENYGFDHPNKSPEEQEKRKQKRIFLSSQPIALEILKYKEKYNLKLGSAWIYKKQEILDSMLKNLKMTYGDMT